MVILTTQTGGSAFIWLCRLLLVTLLLVMVTGCVVSRTKDFKIIKGQDAVVKDWHMVPKVAAFVSWGTMYSGAEVDSIDRFSIRFYFERPFHAADPDTITNVSTSPLIFTKIVEQKESPPFLMKVAIFTENELNGIQIELDADAQYKALEVSTGDFSESNGMAVFSNIVKDRFIYLLIAGLNGQSFPPGNSGIIAEIGLDVAEVASGKMSALPVIHSNVLIAGNSVSKVPVKEVSPEEFNKIVDEWNQDKANLIKDFSINSIFPNPFNNSITINYHIPKESQVEIIIYDLLGRRVKQLEKTQVTPGSKFIIWDGKNELGKPSSSGLYIIKMTAKSMEDSELFTKAQKVVLMK